MNHLLRPFMKLWMLTCLLGLGFLLGCTNQAVQPNERLIPFREAVPLLTQNLLEQVKRTRFFSNLIGRKGQILLDPFVDSASGDVVRASQDIKRLVFIEINEIDDHFEIAEMDADNIKNADYVMTGIITFEPYPEPASQTKQYRLHASIFELDNGEIIANDSVWLAEAGLNYNRTEVYRDAPIYLRDRELTGLITTAQGAVGSLADKNYYEFLQVKAQLVEATAAYEASDYMKALELFRAVADHPQGNTMKTYAGLYLVSRKLDDEVGAEDAFGKMFAIGVETNNLRTKLLFSVNSINFIENEELRSQYQFWLRQIGQYFSRTSHCFQVAGHSSRTGAEFYNKTLSHERAVKIQRLLQPFIPNIAQRSVTVGKGFSENIVGSGTDDARDAVDRRVEFIIVECDSL